MRLPRFKAGAPIAAADLNALAEALEAMSRMSVLGGRLREVGGRWTLNIDAARRGRVSRLQLPFQLFSTTDEGGNPMVGVRPSLLAGDYPASGDGTQMMSVSDPLLFDPLPGEVVVFCHLSIDEAGLVSAREIDHAAVKPDDVAGSDYYLELGRYFYGTIAGEDEASLTVFPNVAYGPVSALICPDYFSDPPTRSASLFAAGAFPAA